MCFSFFLFFLSSVLVSIAERKHHEPKQLREERLYFVLLDNSLSMREVRQEFKLRRNLEVGTEAQAMLIGLINLLP